MQVEEEEVVQMELLTLVQEVQVEVVQDSKLVVNKELMAQQIQVVEGEEQQMLGEVLEIMGGNGGSGIVIVR